jgi:F-type H+-transporting ATPase subunit b
MLIDWFTVAAQIVNFLLLVWLLKRFLYGRILRAIEARESKIAGSLAEADAKQKEATQQLAHYQAELQNFQQQQDTMLAQARLDAANQHTEMLEKAREEVHSLETKWHQDLERDRKAFLLELRCRAATEILAVTRRVLADLASMDVQECVVQVFLKKIRMLGQDDCQNLAKSELSIRTAFDLPTQTQTQIQQTLEERLEMPVCLRFERAPGTGLGLELRGNGWRIGWNSESYLEAMEEDLREALGRSPEAKAHAGAT